MAGSILTHTLSTKQLLEDASNRAIAYLDSLKSRPVRPEPDAVARLSELDVPVPEKPTAPGEVLAQLDQFISPATMAMAGPRFFGFVIGGSLPVTVAANWLATAWDQNTGYAAPTPGASRLEEIARRWLLELLDLPRECAVGFVTGATVANFTALAAARNAVLQALRLGRRGRRAVRRAAHPGGGGRRMRIPRCSSRLACWDSGARD